ncbi:MAG: copper chaperone PCu(A)C [Candidatus Sedimenticola sp. PURPLELP]
MKLRHVLPALGMVMLSACATVMADTAADSVAVSDAYARAVPPGQPNSASFMTIVNNSGKDHALVSAESPVSKVVELHTHTMDEGMMKMRRVEKIDLPAGQTVTLKPGGLHVMLIGLHQDLKPGENVDVTLIFEDGSKTQLQAPIKKLQMKMMKKDMKHDMKNMKH